MNRILTTSLIAASAAALVAGTCAPALADTPTPAPTPHSGRTLAAIQAAAKIKTSDRITKLNAGIARVNAAKGLSSSDQATILATFNADIAGMNTVEAKIQADTDAQTAAADFKTIFTTYRVYAVALPQARIAGAADRMTNVAIPRLNTAESKLSGLLSGKDSGKSTPALQADLTDMQSKIAAATSALNGVAAGALAVTPADFNANHDALSSERAAIKTAVADLKAAETDAKTIRAALH